MKLPTIKYPSGLEVSLAAFLLKMTALDAGEARRFLSTGKDPVFRAPEPSYLDNDLIQLEGSCDKFIDKVQERYGEQKDELRKWVSPEAVWTKSH
jgi:hypothetical protein